jgi:hypothetical protein
VHNRFKERLINQALALYKQGGYTKVVDRAKIIYGEDQNGIRHYLSEFNAYMEVIKRGSR